VRAASTVRRGSDGLAQTDDRRSPWNCGVDRAMRRHLRSGKWHGQETGHNAGTALESRPTIHEHLNTISRGKTRRGDELRERQFITDPRFHPEGGDESGGCEFNRR
jgi:hypothetical protein